MYRNTTPKLFESDYVYPYMPQSFRVRTTARGETTHLQGGRTTDDSATCPRCRRPLLQLWNLDCTAPELRQLGLSLFTNRDRLPLYYCWTCAPELCYRIEPDGRCVMLAHESHLLPGEADDWGVPSAFPERALELAPIPADVQALFDEATRRGAQLSTAELAHVEAWFPNRERGGFHLTTDQLGGLPLFVQGPQMQYYCYCPDPTCLRSKEFDGGVGMRFLAVIHDRPQNDFDMRAAVDDDSVQVLFHVCDLCDALYVRHDLD